MEVIRWKLSDGSYQGIRWEMFRRVRELNRTRKTAFFKLRNMSSAISARQWHLYRYFLHVKLNQVYHIVMSFADCSLFFDCISISTESTHIAGFFCAIPRSLGSQFFLDGRDRAPKSRELSFCIRSSDTVMLGLWAAPIVSELRRLLIHGHL